MRTGAVIALALFLPAAAGAQEEDNRPLWQRTLHDKGASSAGEAAPAAPKPARKKKRRRKVARAPKADAAQPAEAAQAMPSAAEAIPGEPAPPAPPSPGSEDPVRLLGTFAALSAMTDGEDGRALALVSCRRVLEVQTDLRAASGQAANQSTDVGHLVAFCRALAEDRPLEVGPAGQVIEAPGFGKISLGQAYDVYRKPLGDAPRRAPPVPKAEPGAHGHRAQGPTP